jgi:hypothetical protein
MDERNVVNIKEIENWIDALVVQAKYVSDVRVPDEIMSWLARHLRRYLINEYPVAMVVTSDDLIKIGWTNLPQWLTQAAARGDHLYYVSLRDKNLFENVHLLLSCLTDLKEASKYNQTAGREFKKLLNGTIDRTTFDKCKILSEQIRKRLGIEETGINYPDGSRWVLLHSHETIKWEGEEMGNCLKQDTEKFFSSIQRGERKVYSLRDAHDKPRASVLTTGNNQIRQIKGFSNKEIEKQFRPQCFDLIERTGSDPNVFIGDIFDNLHGYYLNGKVYQEAEDVPQEYRT